MTCVYDVCLVLVECVVRDFILFIRFSGNKGMSSNSWEGSMVFLSICSLHQCGFPETGCVNYYKHAVKSFRLLDARQNCLEAFSA